MSDQTTDVATPTVDAIDELRSWLSDNWDPELTVREWWDRLGRAGWSAPSNPPNAYGRGLSRGDTVRVQNEIAAFGALGAPGGLGLMLAGPTIATHGTQQQIDRYVLDIVTGAKAWCQLFSEPGAGSDLAGLTTRAVRDGDEWIVNGQKVWTSMGKTADLGMLLARTDPEVPKHQGITWFAFNMLQEGVEIRPLREMTGHALFNEVFLTDTRVSNDAVIGTAGLGWAAANTTLGFERASLGAGGGTAAGGIASPGTIAGHLDRRAGDFVTERKPSKKAASGSGSSKKPKESNVAVMGIGSAVLIDLAKANGTAKDPLIRQELAKLYTLGEIGRIGTLRAKAARAIGNDIPGLPNISKLMMSEMMRVSRDVGLRITGPAGLLHAYDEKDRPALDKATGNPALAMVTSMALFAQAPSIYGGTDQVQRNIIGERVLGLPKEPGNEKTLPFSQLPRNA